jgi:predicted GNAT family acetyltransferase
MAENIQLELDEKNHGYFYYLNENKRLGEMEISLSENKLTVYHTEVSAEAEG